jgi:hypothetical protein
MLTLAEIKAQLRLDQDDNSEDLHLEGLAAAAVESVELSINRKLYRSGADLTADSSAPAGAMVMTAGLKIAALMVLSDLYNNREASAFTKIEVNPAVQKLIQPHRRMPG